MTSIPQTRYNMTPKTLLPPPNYLLDLRAGDTHQLKQNMAPYIHDPKEQNLLISLPESVRRATMSPNTALQHWVHSLLVTTQQRQHTLPDSAFRQTQWDAICDQLTAQEAPATDFHRALHYIWSPEFDWRKTEALLGVSPATKTPRPETTFTPLSPPASPPETRFDRLREYSPRIRRYASAIFVLTLYGVYILLCDLYRLLIWLSWRTQ